MLAGKLVTLRAIEINDHPRLHSWLNDPAVTVYWGRPGNTVSITEVAREEEREAARGDSRKFIIETVEGLSIGQIDYYDLNWQSRSAWVSILIGDPQFWGGGYGTDAMRALLRFLFLQLGLHRVSLNVHETNDRAQRSYQKNGFTTEGVMRDWAFFDGQWVNGMIMSVLDHEFAQIIALEEPD